MELFNVLVPLTGLIALLYALWRSSWIARQDAGTSEMQAIASAIAEGARAFLKREYRTLSGFVLLIALLLVIANTGKEATSPLLALSFLVGAFCSGTAGFLGMRVATLANVRTTQAARTSLNQALRMAFSGGSVMGMSVVGLGVLGLGGLFLIYSHLDWDIQKVINVISGFSLGASSVALFARVGGGIYTKAADVGADLAGKVYEGIPEDDPRNPAVIADNVGDNVGDVAGMGADLFESYVGSIVSAMVLGVLFVGLPEFSGRYQLSAVLLPLVLAGAGILISLLGTAFVRVREGDNPQRGLNRGIFGSALLIVPVTYLLVGVLLPEEWYFEDRLYTATGVFLATVIGLAVGVLIGLSTEYYCSPYRRPVLSIVRQSVTGPATNIIAGLGVAMESTAIPLVLIGFGILGAYTMAGLYGIALAAVGMLSVTGIQLATDAYGPIADNAGGIAEMSHQPPEVRARTDRLDAVGNTTAAIGKGFAIGSAALTALALFAAFQQQAQIPVINLTEAHVLAGMFIGAVMPFLLSSMAIGAVGRAARQMILEVGRQFREIPGLREGKARPEYARCVDISTRAALREMIAPGLMALIVPVVVGVLDKQMLAGLLAGVTVSGVLMAIFQANAGGAWDNAKKRVEEGIEVDGVFYKKGTEVHKATVVGDTVGDPLKDTSGPSLNILIKLISVISLVIAPLIA
jgi:K(+)-stimulated pyrophosphate-energized sodium pump